MDEKLKTINWQEISFKRKNDANEDIIQNEDIQEFYRIEEEIDT